jgi:hypothetical protein
MPRTVISLEDLDLGEKGIAEMLATVLIRRLTLCFSIVSIAWDTSAFMVVTGAWMGGPRTHHWMGRLWPQFPEEPRTVCLPMFSQTNGQGPEGSFLQGHSLLK